MKVNDMKNIQRSFFKLNPVAAATLLAISVQFPASVALANGAYGTNTNISGATIDVPTFYANSPQGIQPAFDFTTHTQSVDVIDPITKLVTKPKATIDTGNPLRKFVDPLAGAYNGLDGAGIPVAIAEKWVNPFTNTLTADDYFEIAIVEYTENMHSDLIDYDAAGAPIIDIATGKPKLHQTRLRGYVQIETPEILAKSLKDVTGVIGSEHIPALYPDGTPIYKMKKDPASGLMVQDLTQPVFFVHKPHYLGPAIVATKGTAVRIKLTNYLPYNDSTGTSVGNLQGGELFIPVDETIAGGGPVLDVNGKQVLDQNGKPVKMSQNRADIHWHGGDTPWISDGTPHQWFAPAGDISYTLGVDATHPEGMGRGDSAKSVPDMPDPGQGSNTLYFPNNLSGRFMFYHDHTSGLTRLNVYAGMAAGYVIVDPVEQAMVSNALGTSLAATNAAGLPVGKLDAVGIPLVIQDKTFLPKNIGPAAAASDGTIQSQDAKWDLNHWGQPGDLFFPHVYETNQDPNSIDGTNPVGRWDWGPWFWPVFPAQMSLPTGDYGNVTTTPEAFMDTAVVNGQAFPTLTVDPKTYRFRILNAGNDRSLNIGLYQAVDALGNVCDGKALPAPSAMANGGIFPPALCTEVKMVPAVPTAGFPANWPNDGRPGGVPDPATVGPDIVQIGNEGGLLPAPAIWKSQPVVYETNVRSITVLNVMNHDLLLGGAERADVLIDFTKYAGQTLIVYNDAPAPMPGFDPRIDYSTGSGDNSGVGAAYDILPGYGPNTRTIMQIKVNATNTSGTGGALDTAQLATELPKAYAATQPAPIIPEVVYNSPFGTGNVNNYAPIYTGSLTSPVFTYKVAPYTDANGVVQTTRSLPVINKAIQELFDPIYGRMNATLAVELPFSSATVATTIPLNYVDTPVERLDAIKDGETQIWKITHNGVDDHPVHFHLVNVQVINRVSWDGTIRPPEANEVGWKETLRMNPLEDVYVAVKAVHPVVPFGVPKSARVLDPSAAVNSTLGFTNIDPSTGNAPTYQNYLVNGVTTQVSTGIYSNQLTDFDNEYVWHCHILGHEENDFMRPFIFHPNVTVPDAPAMVGVSGTTVSWLDTTPIGGQDAQGIPTAGTNLAYPEPTSSPKNEVGFMVLRNVTTDVTTTTPAVLPAVIPSVKTVTTQAPTALVATVPANATSWSDASVVPPAPTTIGPDANGVITTTTDTYSYSVIAYNAAGNSPAGTSATVTTAGALVGVGVVAKPVQGATPVIAAPAGPTGFTQTINADKSVTLSWTALPGATGYVVSINGVAQAPVTGTSFTALAASLVAGGNNTFTVVAQTPNGTTAAAATSLYNGTALAPVALTASQGNQRNGSPRGSITLTWANNPLNVNNVTGLTLTWRLLGGGGVATNSTMKFAPTATGSTIINLSRDKDYQFTLTANSVIGDSPIVSIRGLSSP
jgi:FtsP/CotA-like multicopper oxidase with cupredoxin domain